MERRRVPRLKARRAFGRQAKVRADMGVHRIIDVSSIGCSDKLVLDIISHEAVTQV
jgi:hypothetical protein